ncbi:MAG: 2-amino-4-hydroxy-6-hydroxymethyldihydropteridine diphosphokinase [Candidatus Rokubacteria bacterium]|nr:2-amino-4-hydroxy-6-hydroxymethyldihydropteridine diphosphokinase [Candidatus Rokubacteria bacterium]
MDRVYLGLGSNVGDRVAMLRAAIHRLRENDEIRVVSVSRLYETEPWETETGRTSGERTWHLNCAIAVETELTPRALLDRLHAVEDALGRARPGGTPEAQRFSPRTVDIDILFYGDRVISVPDELHVPHLLLHERAFVLRPLSEIAPDLRHPTVYRTVREMLAEVEDDHVVEAADYREEWLRD